MKKRRLHIFRLLLVILVPVVFLSACGFGLYQLFKPKEEVVVEKKPVHQPTIEALLKHSLEPIGTTMYGVVDGTKKIPQVAKRQRPLA